MIQTLDFFTPIVDDPYMFGQIAAANSLSDVYAMGGVPKVALNIVGFPNCLDPSILGDILKGGADKVKEAGAVLVGGHTIQNDEPQYGLSVAGFVHPDRIFKNYGCQPGDYLILTKQVGSGVVNTAIKAEMASRRAIREAEVVLSSLNRKAGEVAAAHEINACTDITGFGILGHCAEMAVPSKVLFELDTKNIAYFKDAKEYAAMGLVPAGAYKNKQHAGSEVDINGVDTIYEDLLYDPQTSGGLLLSVPEHEVSSVMRDFALKGMDTEVSIIGRVRKEDGSGRHIRLI